MGAVQRQQKVRMSFLVALTVVVAMFGVFRFLGSYRRTRERTEAKRTADELREYTLSLIHI